jgi:methyl acetate hydrolase
MPSGVIGDIGLCVAISEVIMSLKAQLDAILGRACEAEEVPGVAAMVTDRTGAIYEGAFGRRVLPVGAPMTIDTVAWIASMTKAITVAGAMQLVEAGNLHLEDPAARIVPDISSIEVLEGFEAGGLPRTRPPKRAITLHHLLTHTAGFGYEIWSEEVQKVQAAKGRPRITSCEIAALQAPLLSDPGERWNYGINIDWVGRMIEAVSGKRLSAYLQENILAPLGMNSTAFKITPAMRERLAKVHQRGADDKLVAQMAFELPQEPQFEMGGGGLYSTAGDYIKFLRMILNRGTANGAQVLKPETVDMMSRNAMGNSRVSLLKTSMPSLSNDAEFFPGIAKTWGLAFQINIEAAPTGRPGGGLMWAGLANTYYWIDATNGIGGVFLTQILPFADKWSLPLYYAFEKSVYRALA